MELAACVEKKPLVFSGVEREFVSPKVEKIISLNLKAVNNAQFKSTDQIFEVEPFTQNSITIFVKDFQAVVCTEIEKSLECVALIKQDINQHRTESQVLRKQLYLETSSNERARIQSKMETNKQWMAECEEQIALIHKRILVLHEQLHRLCIQSESI